MLSTEKPVIQTQHSLQALPVSLIKKVPDANVNNATQIKQESPQQRNVSSNEKVAINDYAN